MMCYNARMKPIATNIADFETLRKEGLLYVDKTAHLHRLITKPGSTFFFCARPRRFGKSLSVTTLKSIFLGHREFFDDLAIAKTDYDWKPHAVIHFNWGGMEVSNIETFERTLAIVVGDALRAAGYPYDPAIPPSSNLARAIDFFYKKDGVGPAILIDEYDDPVAKALADVDLAERIRTRLSAIYAQFKDNSGKIRFLYITGVSKFTKLSVFSTLSSLNDISFEADYAALYGYTEEELSANFEGHMHAKAERMGLTYEAFRAELKRWFNGYRFADENPVTVYNPVSIALTLVSTSARFKPTWTSTGRASTLMNYIRREGALSIDPDRAPCGGLRGEGRAVVGLARRQAAREPVRCVLRRPQVPLRTAALWFARGFRAEERVLLHAAPLHAARRAGLSVRPRSHADGRPRRPRRDASVRHLHFRAEGRRDGGGRARPDPREGLRRAISCARVAHHCHWTRV